MTKTPAIALHNVSFRYPGAAHESLSHIDLEVGCGECIVLTGASGCGKTTLTRLLNGLAEHFYEGTAEGEVLLFGEPLRDRPIYEIGNQVGSIFQDPKSQFFASITEDEIAFGCENFGLPRDDIIARVKKDKAAIESRMQYDKEGNKLNLLKIDGVASDDPKVIAAKLHEIEDRERTHGQPKVIGSLYGFDILVKTDTTVKDGLDFCENRFFVRGEGNFLYNYNNGRLAVDPKTACQNFINAFDSIPRLIEKYTKDNEAIEKELPVLEQVVGEVWKKEDELKQLKADLAALDRKILLSLKSVDAQEKSTDGVIEVVPSQPITPDGQNNTPAAVGIPAADASPGTPSSDTLPTPGTPPAEPYVHRMPDFLTNKQRTPPKVSEMPKSISIKEAMGALGGKLVIGGIPKPGNKDDPDPDQSQRPKPKLKL